MQWLHFTPAYWLRKILPRGLFGRSLLIILVPALLLQLIISIVFIDNHWRKVTSRMAYAVAGEITIMADMMGNNFDPGLLADLKILGEKRLSLIVTAEPGRRIRPGLETSGTWEPFTARALSEELEERLGRPFYLSFGPDDQWADISVQMPWGVLHIFALEKRLFSTSAYIFLLWLLGSTVVLFAIAIIFMRNQIRPIHRLAIAAERLGKGRELSNFKPEGAREIRAAARAFIDMNDRIRRQVEQRTAMLAGISHDLRTPLTRLKLGLTMLPESRDVENLKSDIVDMERMIKSYLDFVRGEGHEAVSRVNLNEMILKLADNVRRHGKTVDQSLPADLILSIRPVAFERCLQNLLSNAALYAGHIWISARRENDEIIIEIEDDGPGIEDGLLEEVFKPFFRVDSARNIATGGSGLGLPIARDIVHSHGGSLNLTRSVHGGLCARIVIPV